MGDRPCTASMWNCTRQPSVENTAENKKAKALASSEEAKDKGINFYDLGSVQKIQTRSQVRWDCWSIHLKSPRVALATALERPEQKWVGPIISNGRLVICIGTVSWDRGVRLVLLFQHDGSNVFGG